MGSTHRVTVTLAAVAAGAAMAVAGCAGSGKSAASHVSTANVLAGAYQSALAVHTADLTFDVSVTPASGSTTKLTGSGAIQWQPLAAQFQISLPLGSSGDTNLAFRLIGDDIYVQVPSQLASQTGGKTWIGGSISSLVSSGQAGEFDPADELAVLGAHASSVTKVGRTTAGGVATTEYTADIDLSDTTGESSTLQQLMPKLEQSLGTDELPVQVWIDGGGRLVQFSESVVLKNAPSGVSSQAAGAFPLKETVTETLTNYGTPVSVTAPPAAQVMQIDLGQLLQSAL